MSLEPTHEYQRRIGIIVMLLVEVPVVLVCLLIEHLVEVSTGVHFRRLIRWPFNSDTQSLYRTV